MVDVNHEPIVDEQEEMRIWPPADFCGFGLEHPVHIHPVFEPLPLNANVARYWNGHSSSHFPLLEYIDVDHCGLMYLNDLHQTANVFLNVECPKVKTILLKTRKPFSCRILFDGILPVHDANVPGRLRWLRYSIELKEKNMLEEFQFLHLALHFEASTAPLTTFKLQNFNM